MQTALEMNPAIGPPTARSAAQALFLDLDGTLIELAPRPDAVHIPADLPDLLHALSRAHGGALALLSGRLLAQLDAVIAPAELPAAGVHGAQLRLAAHGPVRRIIVPVIDPIVRELRRRFAGDARLLLEDKQAAVALHYRQASERSEECIQAMSALALEHGLQGGLQVIVGHGVVEARATGVDKGAAIHAFMAHAPFAGRQPVFVGDDRTDEDGFAAAAALGGYGIKVGRGPTQAQYCFAGVERVHQWLRAGLSMMEPAP